MLGKKPTNLHRKLLSIFIAAIALFIASFGVACKNDSKSVASNDGNQSAPANASSNAAAPVAGVMAQTNPSPAADAAPSTVPTTPFGPVGQTSSGAGKPEGKPAMMGNLPITTSKAKPPITPEPDPFPARPTPTVVMAEGKIVQQWLAPADSAKLTSPVKDRPEAAKIGRDYYLQKCADCHGKKGQGNGWMSGNTKRDGKALAPTNLASKMVQANTDGELFWKITNGRSPMPAHRIRFDDEQRWYIVAYLRTLKP
jgi:mono/diheme cytochrome c family protein